MEWYITLDENALDPSANVEWEKIDESQNQLYVTHKSPRIDEGIKPGHTDFTRPLHTVIHNSCRFGKGEKDPVKIGEAIWLDMVDREVHTFDGRGPLGYWAGNNPLVSNLICRSVSGLIMFEDAACGEWAQYFHDLLLMQGFEEEAYIIVLSWDEDGIHIDDDLFLRLQEEANIFFGAEVSDLRMDRVDVESIYAGFLVNEWDLQIGENFVFGEDNASGANPITLLNDNKIFWREEDGIKGQGNDDPRSTFDNHAIVGFESTLYDPSYGTTATGFTNHENGAIAGFVSTGSFTRIENNIEVTYRINWVAELNEPMRQLTYKIL